MHVNDFYPMTLVYEPDLDTVKTHLHTKNEIGRSKGSKLLSGNTDRHRHTERDAQNLYLPAHAGGYYRNTKPKHLDNNAIWFTELICITHLFCILMDKCLVFDLGLHAIPIACSVEDRAWIKSKPLHQNLTTINPDVMFSANFTLPKKPHCVL